MDRCLGRFYLAKFSTKNIHPAKFHEPPILIIFGLELQIMIYLINLASTARHANVMDITGEAAFGRGPCGVDKISMSGRGGKYIMIWSSRPNIINIGGS